MRLPTRRTVWLSAALLLVSVVGIWYLAGQNRITQVNFDRIQEGMSEAEVIAILGEFDPDRTPIAGYREFREGPNWIVVFFHRDSDNGSYNGKSYAKSIHLATVRERLTWYAKKGAARLGVNRD